jgi:DNA-3-methyladenine glycosylase II
VSVSGLHTVAGRLIPRPPFDFTKSLDFLSQFVLVEGEQEVAGRALTRAGSIGGQVIVFRINSTGSTNAPGLAYALHSDRPITAPLQAAAEDRIRFFLSLDDDLEPFYAIGREDPVFAPVVEQLYGYHQVKFLTPFQNACWAILTQRTAIPVGLRSMQALAKRFGGQLAVEGRLYRAFPEPAQFGDADLDELAGLVQNARQADYLLGVIAAFRRVDESWLRTAPVDEVEAWLRQIRGIGAWSASFVIVRGLGRMERLPVGDRRLALAVSRYYGTGRILRDQEIARIAERYGAWRGYWAHYMRVAGS